MTAGPPMIGSQRMPWTARASALSSVAVLGVTLLGCVVLMPRFLFSTNMGGISNYGVHAATVAPYTLGVVAAALLLLRAAAQLAHSDGHSATAALCRLTAVCYLLDLVTTYPYRQGQAWAVLHTDTAILLAVVELLGAVALAWLIRDPLVRWLAVTVLAGFTALSLTHFGWLHILFVAEVVTGGAYGVLLARAAGRPESPTRAVRGR